MEALKTTLVAPNVILPVAPRVMIGGVDNAAKLSSSSSSSLSTLSLLAWFKLWHCDLN